MAQLTESVTRLIDELAKLPGIGRKSAERIAYHILRVNKPEALALADSIRNVRENVALLRDMFLFIGNCPMRDLFKPAA